MSIRPVTRRVFASGLVVAAGVAVMRNLINAEGSPEATPSPETEPQLLIRLHTITSQQAGFSLVSMPEFSLFDDGSIYSLGPQLAVFPPPALPNLTLTRISQEGVQALMAAAAGGGLDQPREISASIQLADAPTTLVTFFDGAKLVTSSATGLMILTKRPADWDEPTWEEFLALREVVSQLIGWQTTVDAARIIAPERSIDPDRVELMVFRATNPFAIATEIPQIEQEPLEWPLAKTLAELAGPDDVVEGIPSDACHELSGAELKMVIDVAQAGNMMSPWIEAGVEGDPELFGVLMRPLLPDQSACAD